MRGRERERMKKKEKTEPIRNERSNVRGENLKKTKTEMLSHFVSFLIDWHCSECSVHFSPK